MKEYKIDIRVKNNLIYQKILQTGCKSIAEFCRKNKLSQRAVGDVIRMQTPVTTLDGMWSEIVKELCDVLSCEPEDIITEEQKQIVENRKLEIYADAQQVMSLTNNSEKVASLEYIDEEIDETTINKELFEQLNTLTPREKEILEMRFGLGGEGDSTLEDCAKKFGVNRERIRQLEARALRKLRHESRSGKLLEMLEWKNNL